MGELIIFSKELSNSEIMKVESYLASKYGIALSDADGAQGGDYISTGGTTYWDASQKPTYNNDIIVIGKDVNTALLQKQAKTENDSLRIFVSSLAAENIINTGSITNDESFLAIGHNGGDLSSEFSPVFEPTNGIVTRFEREWKITNTGFNDNYSLEIEWDSISSIDLSTVRLLVDDDGNFSNATVYSAADGLTFSFGSIKIGDIGTSFIPNGSTRFITVGFVAAPLPVDLSYFNARPEKDVVHLTWETMLEINNDYYLVERSINGSKWEEVCLVKGAGNSVDPIKYSCMDYTGCANSYHYRLTQVDYDGTSEVFRTVFAKNNKCNLDKINITVSHFEDDDVNVKLSLPRDENYFFKIISQSGQLVYNSEIVGTKGEKTFSLGTSKFAPGVYNFVLWNKYGDFVSVRKLKL